MGHRIARLRRLLPVLVAGLLLIGGLPAAGIGAAAAGRLPAIEAASATVFSFPAIGLSGTVYEFGCRGGTLPNRIERWGCAGQNNTYLLGHAGGVFRALHDAYGRGSLRTGQAAMLTSGGVARTYRVAWIRLVPQTYVWSGLPGEQWAWNATAADALTLQTCWGSTSAYRLIVRLTS